MDFFSNNSTLIDNQLTESMIAEFKAYITEKKHEYTDMCLKEFYLVSLPDNILVNNIRNFPKCSVMMARRMCNCDPNCFRNALIGLNFNPSCSIFNVQNIYLDDKHINCDYLSNKNNESDFLNDNLAEFQKAKKNFQNLIYELCETTEVMPKIQCAAYTLRDTCGLNKERCDFIYEIILPTSCKNKDFVVDFDSVKYFYNYESYVSPEIKYITATIEKNTESVRNFRNKTKRSEPINIPWKSTLVNKTNFSINSQEVLKNEDFNTGNLQLRISEVGCLSSAVIITALCFVIFKLKKKGNVFKYALILPIILFVITFYQLVIESLIK